MDTDRLQLLHDAASIRRRVTALAQQIDADSGDIAELVVIGVLDGAFVFVSDLVRAMKTPCRVEFVKISSYREGERQAELRLIADVARDVQGAHLLLVDDILDSGKTLAFLRDRLARRAPASCRSCALVQRSERGSSPDYVGFEVGAGWIVGYGMDLDGRLRDLPYLAIAR
jgi:hypoxanthine phosphoribosyltransferase